MQVLRKHKTTILHGVILIIVMSILVGCSSPGITSTQENDNKMIITKEGDSQKSLATDVIQAESFNLNSGVTIQTWGVPAGQAYIGNCDMGDYVKYSSVDFGSSIPYGQPSMQFITNIANGCTTGCDGHIEIWLDSRYGTRIGTLKIPYQGTGAWNTFKEVKTFIPNTTGVHDVYLVFAGYNAANVDWFKFASAGYTISDYSGVYVNAEACFSIGYANGIQFINGNRIGYLDANDSFSYTNINFGTGINVIEFMIACPNEFAGKYIDIYIDNSIKGRFQVWATDPNSQVGWDNFRKEVAYRGDNFSGIHNISFQCVANPSAIRPDVGFGNIDWIKFNYVY